MAFQSDVYPTRLRPVLKDKPWGRAGMGRRFLAEADPGIRVGEIWLTAEEPEPSRVINGPLAGASLRELRERWGEKLVGRRLAGPPSEPLPFLLKYIHAAERLSVQVHPDDETAAKLEGTGPGKTEAWYILNAPAGARLIAGLRPKTTRDDLTAALNEGRLEDLLHEVEPQAGDTFYIHAGLVHSIGPDVGLFEIQQNIDLTYRFHDWNRTDDQGRPRPLHPEKALAALELNPEDIRPFGGLHFRCEDRRATALAAGRYFYLELAECHGPIGGVLDGDRFEIWTPLSGSARLLAAGTPDAGLTLEPGPAVLLPAALGEYALQPDGAFTYLRAFVPDLSAEVVQPLKHEGFSADEIVRLGGFGAKNDLKPLV